jgi:hypothetical protein
MSPITAGASRDGYALAYREARMGLEDQERSVVELRARAGALIAAASIATSFFGGQTLLRHDLSAVAWFAICCSWCSDRVTAMFGKPTPQPSPVSPRPEPVRPSPMIGETRGGSSSSR